MPCRLMSGIQGNHLWFKNNEPTSPLLAAAGLLLQPLLLYFAVIPSLSPVRLPQIYAVFFATVISSMCTYRLSPLHPLAKIPGPRLNKLTKFCGAYVAYSGRQHFRLKQLHEEYGPIVRTGGSLNFPSVNFSRRAIP